MLSSPQGPLGFSPAHAHTGHVSTEIYSIRRIKKFTTNKTANRKLPTYIYIHIRFIQHLNLPDHVKPVPPFVLKNVCLSSPSGTDHSLSLSWGNWLDGRTKEDGQSLSYLYHFPLTRCQETRDQSCLTKGEQLCGTELGHGFAQRFALLIGKLNLVCQIEIIYNLCLRVLVLSTPLRFSGHAFSLRMTLDSHISNWAPYLMPVLYYCCNQYLFILQKNALYVLHWQYSN